MVSDEEVIQIVQSYPAERRYALAAMQDMQHAFNRGSVNLAAGLKRELGIDPGETTEDGMFSVEMVNCLGSCALAPVMLVDGTYHNKLKLEDVPGIVERYRRADAEEGEAGND